MLPLHYWNKWHHFLYDTICQTIVLLTLMLLGMSVAVGQSVTVWTVDNLPMVHLQDARRYVCDPDGLLSVAARDSADRMLAVWNRQKA